LLLVSCVAMLTLSGCFRILVPVSTTWPAINVPQRPHIEIPDNVGDSPNEKALTKATFQYSRHIDVLETIIKTYNKEAKTHNAKVEHELFGD